MIKRALRLFSSRIIFPLKTSNETVVCPLGVTNNNQMKGYKTPIHAAATWVRRQPPKIKIFLAVITALAALVFLRMVVEDHDSLFVVAEAAHAIGISVLIYKLTKERTCAGLF